MQWAPIVWWLPALVCPFITYLYFLMFTHEEKLGRIVEKYLDAAFAAACVASALFRWWRYF